MTIRHFQDRSWLILNIKRTLIKFSHAFKTIEKNKHSKDLDVDPEQQRVKAYL